LKFYLYVSEELAAFLRQEASALFTLTFFFVLLNYFSEELAAHVQARGVGNFKSRAPDVC